MPETNTTCGRSAGTIAAAAPPDTRLKSQFVSVGPDIEPTDEDTGGRWWSVPLDLGRLTWLVTVCGLLVGVIVLAFKRDWGYAGVTGAVAISAAINLF